MDASIDSLPNGCLSVADSKMANRLYLQGLSRLRGLGQYFYIPESKHPACALALDFQ
jgi:hypothetical protein